jgi:ABC-type branched-subunit amino acid transport system permease subunit
LKGHWGRALQTLSAGDAVATVSGLSVRAWKMVVFTVSAGIAGLAGVLFASVNITVTGGSFIPEQSVFLLVFAVVGGITTPAGAVLAGVIAGASSSILNLIVSNPGSWSLVLFGLMAIQMAIMYPAGYGGMLPKSLPGLETLGAWARSRWSRRQLAAAARGAR